MGIESGPGAFPFLKDARACRISWKVKREESMGRGVWSVCVVGRLWVVCVVCVIRRLCCVRSLWGVVRRGPLLVPEVFSEDVRLTVKRLWRVSLLQA